MADKQYEYRITELEFQDNIHKTIWFRSTNYMAASPYGWKTLTTTWMTDETQLLNAVKQLGGMDDCRFIPARPEVRDVMYVYPPKG